MLVGRAGTDFMLRVAHGSDTRIVIGDAGGRPATAKSGASVRLRVVTFLAAGCDDCTAFIRSLSPLAERGQTRGWHAVQALSEARFVMSSCPSHERPDSVGQRARHDSCAGSSLGVPAV